METGRDIIDEQEQEEQEPQSMLMRLIAMAKRKMAQGEEEARAAQEETGREAEERPPERREAPAGPREGAKPSGEPKKKPEPVIPMMGKNNPLYILSQKYLGFEADSAANPPWSEFMEGDATPASEELRALAAIQRSAQQMLQTIAAQEKNPDKTPDPIPARFFVQASSNRMRAWGFVTGPMFGGADITAEVIRQELEKQKIVYGIDGDAIERMASGKRYFRLFPIATGKKPVDGKDGRIEDHFLRDAKIRLKEKDDLTVDYKNLNWIQKVEEGGIVCDIVLPTAALSGINILGAAVQGRDGKKAIPPKGKNTQVTEDETRLIATVGGQVEFHHGQFHVEQLTTIQGDVDNSTGNIDVIGNVVVGGDVREGFAVKATGDIAVKGKVEGAIIIAGGNIQIGMGMNGSLTGSLEAKGDIRTKYLENCTVHAGGCIYSDSIVNSNVSSDRDINITFGLGAIIGGTVMAANSISARLIGNKSNRTTALILGGTPGILMEKSDVEQEFRRTRDEIEELQKNLQYIGRSGALTPEYKRMQNDFKLKLSMMNIQQAKLKQRLEELTENLDPSNCRLTCKTIYPITQVTIGNATRIIRELNYNCNIYYAEGEVRVGVL